MAHLEANVKHQAHRGRLKQVPVVVPAVVVSGRMDVPSPLCSSGNRKMLHRRSYLQNE